MFRFTAPARATFRATIMVAMALILTTPCARAAEAPLTLAEAQRQAVLRSRMLSAQESAVAASRDMAVAASQLPDPVLKLGIDNLPVNGPDAGSLTRDFMTMRRIGLMQEITRDEKRELRAARFEREAEKGVAEKSVLVAAIERDTALAWLDRYYAESMAAVVVEQAGEAKLEITAAEGAYRAGRGSQADILMARSALVGLEDRASEINRRLRTATTMLARWVGAVADAPLAGKPAIDVVRVNVQALESDLAHHPQIEVLAKQEALATTEAKLAQANKRPDWSIEVAYQQRGPSYSNMISVGLSVPLPWDQTNRQDREVASKLAMADQARAQREDALRAHIAEVRSMLIEWDSGRDRVARYERDLIPLAKERTAATLVAYRGGKASVTDVLAARRNEIEVRMQMLQLEQDTARLWAQLNFLFPADGAVPSSAYSISTTLLTKDTR